MVNPESAADDRWPDDMIRLLRERAPAPEPTATETLASIGEELARYGAFVLFTAAIAIVGLGVMTGWLG